MTARSLLKPELRVESVGNGLRAAFAWWWETMASIWPLSAMEQTNGVPTKTVFIAGMDEAEDAARGEDPSLVLPLALETMSEDQVERLRTELPQTRAVVRLAAEQTYAFQTALPKAALGHGSHAIEYALKTASPIPVDQIYHDSHSVVDGDTASVTVTLVRRNTVEEIIQFFEAHALPLEKIVAAGQDNDGTPMHFSFFQRASIAQGLLSRKVGIALALGLFVTPLVIGFAIWAVAAWQTSSRQSAIEAQQAAYGSEIAIARAFDDVERAAGLLNAADTKAQVVNVLVDLSATIPNNTWVDRLAIDGQSLDVQGMSLDPNGVAAALRNAPTFSSVRLDRVTAAGDESQPPVFGISATFEEVGNAQ